MIWHFNNSNTKLFGSFHVLKDGANPYINQIDNIYSGATRIILEANLEGIDLSILTYSDGQRLADNIPPKLYRKTKEKWLKCGFLAQELEVTKPWQIANKLIMNLLQKRGFTFENGIDKQLLNNAKKDNKEISFLEPANAAFDCFDKAPKEEQTEYLSMIINDPDAVVNKFNTTLTAWSKSDTPQLSFILQEGIAQLPVLYQNLIITRNKTWLNEIAASIEANTPALITVGALHCVGDVCSIQNMIRDIHGYDSSVTTENR